MIMDVRRLVINRVSGWAARMADFRSCSGLLDLRRLPGHVAQGKCLLKY